MFKIRNIAATGFDRAIVAMRREHGGRELSDSEWWNTCEHCSFGGREFIIGPGDKEECLRLIESADRDFLKFVGVWAHVEAPAQWWAVYSGYFLAHSDVIKKGDTLTRSVFTTYGHLRNLAEVAREGATANGEAWKTWTALRDLLEELPENWMILWKREA